MNATVTKPTGYLRNDKTNKKGWPAPQRLFFCVSFRLGTTGRFLIRGTIV